MLQTANTRLRSWSQEDADDLLAVFGDPQVMRFWNTPPATSVADVRAMIGRSIAASEDHHKGFAIVLRETGRVVGFINYHHREAAHRRLEIGFILAAAHQQRGLAREVVSAFLTYCFGELQSHRVEALTDPMNIGSRTLLERVGFKQEGGLLRQRIILGNGHFGDQIVYARLVSDS
jgi:[ribosomal protein S5]-alanine N-acetyltransferase